MKTSILSSALLLAAATLVIAQDARYVTVVATGGTTNQIQIADFEVGELVMWEVTGVYALIQKDGVSMPAYSYHNGHGLIVQGPAVFSFFPSVNNQYAQLATVRITPASFPPDKTIIIPPGTNQFQLTFETSTNLLSWASTTNGIYGSPDSVRFFRIHMQKLN